MSWTVTTEDHDFGKSAGVEIKRTRLHIRGIIDIEDQAEIKELIASLQKHVKEVQQGGD